MFAKMVNFMINENWKAVVGYEGLYEVSDLGNVRSLNYNKTGAIQVMKHKVSKRGYLCVHLSKKREAKTPYIHILVAEAFIPNPDNLTQVNHKDENKTNNRVENLEWCDCKYNNNYGTRTEKCSKKVAMYTKEGVLNKTFVSIIDAERQTGIGKSDICKCCRNVPKHKTAGGYIWRYA